MPDAEHTTATRVSAWDAEAREAWMAEDFTRARQLFEKVLEIQGSLDNVEELIFALIYVTQAMRFEPDYQPTAAQPLLEEALTLAEQSGLASCSFAVQVNLAVVALEQAEYTKALALAQQLLTQSLGSDEATCGMLLMTGLALAGLGQSEDALRLYAAGTALRGRIGIAFNDPPVLRQHEQMLAGARAALGPERQASVEWEGRNLSVERAVAQALAMTASGHVQQRATTSHGEEGNAN